jgi:hypothetical protein
LFDVNDFLFNLIQEWAAFEPLFLLICEEDGEVRKALW